MSLLNSPPRGDISTDAKASINAQFYPALFVLGLLVALLTGGTALNLAAGLIALGAGLMTLRIRAQAKSAR